MNSIYKESALYYKETGKKPTHVHLGHKQIRELYDLVKDTFDVSFEEYKKSAIQVMEYDVVLVDDNDYIGFSYLDLNRTLTKREALDCIIQSGESACQCCGELWVFHKVACDIV